MVGVALAVLGLAAGQAGTSPQATIAELDELVSLYRSYDLPFPPKASPLSRVVWGGRADRGPYCALYPLEPQKADRPFLALFGTLRDFSDRKIKPIPLTAASAKRVDLHYLDSGSDVFHEDVGLGFAAIEHSRGHDAFALEMLRQTKKDQFPPKQPWLVPSENDDIEIRVAYLAMQYWTNQIFDTDSDRAVVVAHMRQILQREPKVANEENRKALRHLELTVSRRYSGPDADEALIDRICDAQEQGSRLVEDAVEGGAVIHPYPEIVLKGLAFVPALLRHLGDERLTRCVHRSDDEYDEVPSRLCTVGDACFELLSQYANQKKGRSASPGRAKALEAWWMRASRLSEREYCLRSLSRPGTFAPSEALMFLAEKRHPEVVPIAFRAALQSGREINTEVYFDAMARLRVPKASVVRLAIMAARNQDCEGFVRLKHLEPALFDSELTKALRKLGRHPTDKGVAVSSLTHETSSGDVWRELAEATRRADPDEKVDLIVGSCYPSPDETATKRRWSAYVLPLVDDRSTTTKAMQERVVGIVSGRVPRWPTPKKVGDMVAAIVVDDLKLRLPAKPADSRAFWTKLRATAKAALSSALRSRPGRRIERHKAQPTLKRDTPALRSPAT